MNAGSKVEDLISNEGREGLYSAMSNTKVFYDNGTLRPTFTLKREQGW